jgi:hypothetical protein
MRTVKDFISETSGRCKQRSKNRNLEIMVNLFVNASFNDEPLHQLVCEQHLKGMKDEKLHGKKAHTDLQRYVLRNY